jgi:hypothetical protein
MHAQRRPWQPCDTLRARLRPLQVMIKALQMGVEIFLPLALTGCAIRELQQLIVTWPRSWASWPALDTLT